MFPNNKFGTCVYCGKQIMWIRTKTGKNMPVNTEMIGYYRPKSGIKGSEKIVTQSGEVICANRAYNRKAEGIGYISHFATCSKRKR